jgi:hypothetical protein
VDFEIDVYLLTTRVGPYREGGRLWLCVQQVYTRGVIWPDEKCARKIILKSSCVQRQPWNVIENRHDTTDVKIAGRAGRCKSWRTKIQTCGTPTIDFEYISTSKLSMN